MRADRHIAGQRLPKPEVCDCGHAPTPSKLSTGYALTADGRTLCYDCAADLDRRTLREHGSVFCYARPARPEDGEAPGWKLTTWAGVILGHAHGGEPRRNHRRYFTGSIDGILVHGSGPSENGDYVHMFADKRQGV